RRDLLGEGEIQLANPIERFLVKRCHADAGSELLAGEFDSSHVGQIFIINDQIDAGVPEGKRLRVRLGAGGLPSGLPRERQLRLKERPCDVDKYIESALPVIGRQSAGEFAGHVAQAATHFENDLWWSIPPA